MADPKTPSPPFRIGSLKWPAILAVLLNLIALILALLDRCDLAAIFSALALLFGGYVAFQIYARSGDTQPLDTRFPPPP